MKSPLEEFEDETSSPSVEKQVELDRRRWAEIQRQNFIKDAVAIQSFGQKLAVVPTTKDLKKLSREMEKTLPRLIKYLGGDEAKRVKSAPVATTPTDAVSDILEALRRVNPELDGIARNTRTMDPAKNQKIVLDLERVRDLLQRLQ